MPYLINNKCIALNLIRIVKKKQTSHISVTIDYS